MTVDSHLVRIIYMRQRLKYYVLGTVVLALCVSGGILKYSQLRKIQGPSLLQSGKQSIPLNQPVSPLIENKPDSPIQKDVYQNNSQVVWQVEGIVVQDFYQENNLLAGSIYVKGDKKQAEIPVLLGNLDGSISIGEF